MKRLIPLLAVMAMAVSSFGQNWSIAKFGNMEYYPNTCYFFDANTGLYVGQNGAVMYTTDGTQSGYIVREPQSSSAPSWTDVGFANDTLGYACGYKGMIFKTTDAGYTWTEVGDTSNYTMSFYKIAVVNENLVYVAGSSGTLLKTTNGGATWEKIAFSFEANGSVRSLDGGLAFCNADTGVVAAKTNSAGGATWYTHDGGNSWTLVQLNFPYTVVSKKIFDVDAYGKSTFVIAAYGYTVFLSTDAGETYQQIGKTSSEGVYFQSIQALDANTFVAGGMIGHITMTTDGGATWKDMDLPVSHTIKTLYFVNEQTGFVFAGEGQWFRTHDGGATWENILDWPNVTLRALAVTPGGKMLVGGYRGNTSLSTDGGQTWSYLDNHLTGFTDWFYSAAFATETVGLIGGRKGKLFRTTDGGQTWALLDSAANPMRSSGKSIYTIYFLDENTALAGGSSGYIMKSTDGGATWTLLPSGGSSTIYDIWQVSSKQVIACASSGKIFISNETVDAFSEAHDYGTMTMRGVRFRGDNGVVVATKGYIYHTTVARWDTLEQVFVDPDGDDLLSVTFVNDSTVYVVGEHGKVYTSNDGGLTWEQDTDEFDSQLERVAYVNNKIWAVGYHGLVVMKNLGATTGLYINEFMASNNANIADENGDYDDWIEIYNSNGYSVNIGGMYITDDLGDPMAWQIPDTNAEATTIMPGEYLLLWADKEPEQGILHCNIKLSSDGEQVGLAEMRDGAVHFIDSLTFGPQIADTSYGRMPDGGDTWVSFYEPSPGWSNDTMGVVSVRERYNSVVTHYTLSQNYPNPFNPSTTIKFSLAKAGRATLTVYSVTGQKIATLFNKRMNAGQVEVRWNASRLASGVYFYELKSGSFKAVKKMLLVK